MDTRKPCGCPYFFGLYGSVDVHNSPRIRHSIMVRTSQTFKTCPVFQTVLFIMTLLKEVACVYPPLQAMVGGLLCLALLVRDVNENAHEFKRIERRIDAILKAVASAMPTPRIPPAGAYSQLLHQRAVAEFTESVACLPTINSLSYKSHN
ncbi:hypothetical protein OF83DRAFT_794943 [Amylostereum chailletii]|nr:hypothetical protein OF83DRAFT_794943 [Amylostereum chailletii]